MNINGISKSSSQTAPAGAGTAMDAESKNIQKQISDAQKKLQEISSNGELSTEEKMKKRQEIQKQISDLRMQLRQHQTDLKRQEREERKASREAASGGERKTEDQGFSSAGMEAVISADASMKQAKIQNGAARSLEGKADVLEIEIKQDGGRGGNTAAKEAELTDTKQRASKAEASGMETLKEANQTVREAAKTEKESGIKGADLRTDKEDGKAKGEESIADKMGQNEEEAESRTDKNAEKMPGTYVDVRL